VNNQIQSSQEGLIKQDGEEDEGGAEAKDK
jgi:hypothetical protein